MRVAQLAFQLYDRLISIFSAVSITTLAVVDKSLKYPSFYYHVGVGVGRILQTSSQASPIFNSCKRAFVHKLMLFIAVCLLSASQNFSYDFGSLQKPIYSSLINI